MVERLQSKNYRSFISLLNEIDSEKRTQRDRGTLFEHLTIAYLTNEPIYKRLYEKVWKINEVPEEYNIPKKDTGVDLVAKERQTGELVAIQCKFHGKDNKIKKDDIDSFLNEVGKTYYSKGLIVSSTDEWTQNAEEAIKNRDKDIQRIGLSNFYGSQIDWSAFSFSTPDDVKVVPKKTPRSHQIEAIKAVVEGFETADRGKLIMAPGTGKTYTSLAIAEELASKKFANEKDSVFRVLYLVPSIQLLSQTLHSWNADTRYEMVSIAVCSDRKVTKRKGNNELEDIAASDIGYPATTNYEKLLEYKNKIEESDSKTEFLTVFSTYQSIDVIIEAQKHGFYEFDLVVCDEAHRTTGAKELNAEESAFTKVHSNDNIKAKKRLYQTATPRVYGEDAKKKAEEKSVIIADMNDPKVYGEEFYRLGFGEAIRRDILTDYKVMILAVDEKMVAKRFQKMLANEKELQFDDVTKIIGCWNGLVKRKSNSDEVYGKPMKRAIAFTGTIKESKLIAKMFQQVVEEYLYDTNNSFSIEIKHADGSMNALQKNEMIAWLKSEVPENTCRILTNARFLTEGVDVPELDAVMFLKPRRSKIDIAQAVGRVMRKAPGKEYGYIILPIGIPEGVDENSVLDNHKTYSVVWEVLNALRSLDERFDSMINKLELNKKKPGLIGTTIVGDPPSDGLKDPEDYQMELDFSELTEVERAIYGKIVKKVGNVRYWEDWSKDVAKIAQQHMTRIRVMLEDNESFEYKEFQKFLKSLRYNINNSISEEQAVEMLAQHMITKPVFEALFESYDFIKNNPVSRSMEAMIEVLDKNGLSKEQEQLQSFYESVKVRAEGVDNLEGKQKIIIQLYEKFFKVAFKDTTERLGIVFTPIEVVDFIIHSVEYVLKKHFGKSLASEGVHVLDPFTGTGTFIVRLLQSGLISKEDLVRKYTQELHANETILLSYYIAAINIEETFHSIMSGNYVPFEGIVLTDTFETTENKDSFMDELFDENNIRLKRQQESPIFAIIGNPPYSAKQKSMNDNNENIKYPILDERIKNTYVKHTNATNKNSLYDLFIKAFRWSTDRLGTKGVVAFVTNNSFLDGKSADGFRKCLAEDFNYLYFFDLRGDQRTLGEKSREEGGKIFGSGSRAGIVISVLIKDGSNHHEIYYRDIGSYLSREDKLRILKESKSIANIEFKKILPDKYYNWLNQSDANYEKLIPLYGSKESVFLSKETGIQTSRDPWAYNSNKKILLKNIERLINAYNQDREKVLKLKNKEMFKEILTYDSTKIKWSSSLMNKVKRNHEIIFDKTKVRTAMYRPFVKKNVYLDKDLIHRIGSSYKMFPTSKDYNEVITISGTGGSKTFSTLITNEINDVNVQEASAKSFPLYLYDNAENNTLFKVESRRSNINPIFKKLVEKKIGRVSDEEVFYYVYGILHHPNFTRQFANDLKKQIPRIPICKSFREISKIGRKLAELHLNYEKVPIYKGVTIESKNNPSFKVKQMKHPKKGQIDKIVFNNDITISNIPEKAYDYVVNGRSAIEWIMDQYQIKTDKDSGIIDDPNEYSDDEKYIFNLLLRIINVSVQTVDLVNSLPPLEIEEKD